MKRLRKLPLFLSILILGSVFGTIQGLSEPRARIPTERIARDPSILIWSENGNMDLELTGIQTNATIWGYSIRTNEGILTQDILEEVVVLIVNVPLYLTVTQIVDIVD
ncbi:MAG: hypothetical protein EAX86_11930 [Candidatus Heimdallarchaeota archaeon]|nr:hypothetical protein [Candidatus Heimdallarchaeota archaeon]